MKTKPRNWYILYSHSTWSIWIYPPPLLHSMTECDISNSTDKTLNKLFRLALNKTTKKTLMISSGQTHSPFNRNPFLNYNHLLIPFPKIVYAPFALIFQFNQLLPNVLIYSATLVLINGFRTGSYALTADKTSDYIFSFILPISDWTPADLLISLRSIPLRSSTKPLQRSALTNVILLLMSIRSPYSPIPLLSYSIILLFYYL